MNILKWNWINNKTQVKNSKGYHRFRTMIIVVKTTNLLLCCLHNDKKIYKKAGLNQLHHGEHAWVLGIRVRNVKYAHFVFFGAKNTCINMQHLRCWWRLHLITTIIQKLFWVYIGILKQKITLTYFNYACGEKDINDCGHFFNYRQKHYNPPFEVNINLLEVKISSNY